MICLQDAWNQKTWIFLLIHLGTSVELLFLNLIGQFRTSGIPSLHPIRMQFFTIIRFTRISVQTEGVKTASVEFQVSVIRHVSKEIAQKLLDVLLGKSYWYVKNSDLVRESELLL